MLVMNYQLHPDWPYRDPETGLDPIAEHRLKSAALGESWQRTI